ncbi:hypothetical protein [Dyadobacter sp. 22481]|uniref:hypothetical protein n=1 Tax=Dyadobacter sp. 22481 TaxID=3453926 RepID=UPI003F870337
MPALYRPPGFCEAMGLPFLAVAPSPPAIQILLLARFRKKTAPSYPTAVVDSFSPLCLDVDQLAVLIEYQKLTFGSPVATRF